MRMKKNKQKGIAFEITIKGNPNYLNKMFHHLLMEHPSTKKRMKLKRKK